MAKQARRTNGRAAAKTPKPNSARTTREAWTKQDLAELKKHSKGKAPVAKIAKTMGRSEGALRQKAYALDLALGHRR